MLEQKQQKTILSEKRDLPVLMFLWKWKIATTSCLAHKFWPGSIPATAYRRLWLMDKANYITTRALDKTGARRVWTLDSKGFDIVKDHLPELKEQGYKSENPWHDLICNALHLGDFLGDIPPDILLITEQQMRRYHSEFLPGWLPNPEEHRPDGYWKISNKSEEKLIAFEVELHRKRSLTFHKSLEFYRSYHSIQSVLWIVSDVSVAERISHLNTKICPESSHVHNFVLLDDFLTNGWQAKIKHGESITSTISSFLFSSDFKRPTEVRNNSVGLMILNTQLVPRNYNTSTSKR